MHVPDVFANAKIFAINKKLDIVISEILSCFVWIPIQDACHLRYSWILLSYVNIF
jgi:hypothetical protein